MPEVARSKVEGASTSTSTLCWMRWSKRSGSKGSITRDTSPVFRSVTSTASRSLVYSTWFGF
eukprot:439253-Prorocentrum_minimum.AAC.1